MGAGKPRLPRGDIEEGIAEHSKARLLLRPEADLRSWGRFHKASATMRVARGDAT